MNICLAFFPIDDMGGIINHNEELCAGLQELGHSVHTKLFIPKTYRPKGVSGGASTLSPYTRFRYDQRRGYSWPQYACVPYRGSAKQEAIDLLNSFDLIIWQVAVPTKRKENQGNLDWIDLYFGTTTRQIAVIHDGNFLASYPWLETVAPALSGLACVHHCAYNSAKNISVPSALIYNPQDITKAMNVDRGHFAFSCRTKGFLSVQTFKAWKRVPELVAAVPHTKGIECNLAGKGIDYYYLTSKDKCKWPGIWDAAIEHGMKYHDVITNNQRDEILKGVTCLVDPSWSLKYAAIGGHFNRVMIDAILCGAVPIARPRGIGAGKGTQGEIFGHDENCLLIPQDVSAKEYGEYLEDYCNLPYAQYSRILDNGMVLLRYFARATVASEFLGLADGDYYQLGNTTEQVKHDSAKAIWEFFK